ncbi:hypothetical protein SAMN06264365_109127 [Actinoplanes regularis]|uniref:DUF2795 domain-containing protein n=1 Tax=Actinoplanes regularis TaxID=52697 RepID=A0A239BF82_9ACTN|nr:hypothetical protein Are01nite_44050 [Actinoplanes regularis]SNS05774.1 hypothetical protein SAMN06264365_109127 [Actinoplanes regularis]
MPRTAPGNPAAVTDEPIGDGARLTVFLDQAYRAEERLTSGDLQRRAIAEDLPATLLTQIDALPEGEYLQDEAAEALQTLAA